MSKLVAKYQVSTLIKGVFQRQFVIHHNDKTHEEKYLVKFSAVFQDGTIGGVEKHFDKVVDADKFFRMFDKFFEDTYNTLSM